MINWITEVVEPKPKKCPLCCTHKIPCYEGEEELCKDPTICPELNPKGNYVRKFTLCVWHCI